MRSTPTARIEESPASTGLSPAFVTGSHDLRIVETERGAPDENMAAILQVVLHKVERLEQLFAFVPLLIAQTGRCTSHLTVDMAALALGVSGKTIRRRIREKKLVLETIPGTRVSGIRIDQLFRDWLPIELARRIADDELRELAETTRKDHR